MVLQRPGGGQPEAFLAKPRLKWTVAGAIFAPDAPAEKSGSRSAGSRPSQKVTIRSAASVNWLLLAPALNGKG